jgi:hypothetical protein
MMWDDAVFTKVTGCRTPGGDAPRRIDLRHVLLTVS